MTKSVLVALAVVSLAVVLVIVLPWRAEPNRAPAEATPATRGLQDEPPAARATAPVAQDAASSSPTVAPAATPGVEASRDSVPAEQDLKAVIEGIDLLLAERNVIVRAPPPGQTGPGFVELEQRFGTETADASWSRGMEVRILDAVAQVSGLKLVSLETECRATICRVKLFHPPGTNALTSVGNLVPIASSIGFAHVVHAATLGDNRVPISVLYFQRLQVSANSAQ